jgi:hypothetical protein
MIEFLGVPLNYWFIMIASHLIHIYLKVEADVRDNKIAIKDYFHSMWKIAGVFVSFFQSCVLLIAGLDAYQIYVQKTGDDLSTYVSFVVAFIGYGGSSLWNNIMDVVKNKVNNVTSIG